MKLTFEQFEQQRIERVLKKQHRESFGLIYIIGVEDDSSLCKIGISSVSAQKRLTSLQTGSSLKLILLAEGQVNKPRQIEKFWHMKLADFRVNGEWFRLDEETKLIVCRSVRGYKAKKSKI